MQGLFSPKCTVCTLPLLTVLSSTNWFGPSVGATHSVLGLHSEVSRACLPLGVGVEVVVRLVRGLPGGAGDEGDEQLGP